MPRTPHTSTSPAPATRRPPRRARGATDGPGAPAPELALPYTRADGTRRRVLVAVDEPGTWHVYDVSSGESPAAPAFLVDRLPGCDEVLGQALALANDYLDCQIKFHAGDREDMPFSDPLANPKTVAVSLARGHAARARRIVRRYDEQQSAAQTAACTRSAK